LDIQFRSFGISFIIYYKGDIWHSLKKFELLYTQYKLIILTFYVFWQQSWKKNKHEYISETRLLLIFCILIKVNSEFLNMFLTIVISIMIEIFDWISFLFQWELYRWEQVSVWYKLNAVLGNLFCKKKGPHIILERSIPYIVQTSRNIIGLKWIRIFNTWLVGLWYVLHAVSSRVISPFSYKTNFPRQHLICITHLLALICIALTEIEIIELHPYLITHIRGSLVDITRKSAS
jgi:hypothetical protein